MTLGKIIRNYTNGMYKDICNYSRSQDEAVSEDIKAATQELSQVIDQQPIEAKSLVRVERLWNSDNIEVGSVINFGIASTSRNKELFNLIAENKVEGLSEYQDDCTYVEYRFKNSRSLDVSKQSDFDQQEELVHGKYKVVSKCWQPDVAATTFEEIDLNNFPIIKTRLSKRGLKVFTYIIDGEEHEISERQTAITIVHHNKSEHARWIVELETVELH